MWFSRKVSNLELWSLLKSYMGFSTGQDTQVMPWLESVRRGRPVWDLFPALREAAAAAAEREDP